MSWRQCDTAISHFISSSDEAGLQLHIRSHGDTEDHAPVLFVHGATYASRLYDIPHPGMSWLKACADAGFAAYAVDIRGYGLSRSTVRDTTSQPYARADAAIRDIDDAVSWISTRHGNAPVRLIGGSWGSITTACYVSGPGAEKIDRLILYAPIFAARNQGWLSLLADPVAPDRLNPAMGATRLVDEAGTRYRWDAEIPSGKVEAWRDEEVFQALVQSSLDDDPIARAQTPPAFRAPNGTLVDLWEVFNARPLYDPARITCPVMLIRGGDDPTSTRADALSLFDRLGTARRRYVEIANGTHFVSAERFGPNVFAVCNDFMTAPG